MRTERKVIPHYIKANDGFDLAKQLTDFILAHEVERIQDDIHSPYGTWVWYVEEHRVKEDLIDEFEEAGETYHCKDCPYLQITSDKRRKTFPCEHSQFGVSSKSSLACKKFYEDLVAGKIELRKEKE